MVDIKNCTNGYYSVGKELFTNKLYAVSRGIEKKLPVKWHYFDEVFKSTNKTNLGIIPLTELYRQRAQQLRDEYDYLVLYYSGGSDSWTILNTFITNKIKLDCVFVHQPLQLDEKKTYVPNTLDRSGFNQFSEWDFVIKKDLLWLKQYYPEIKIEIGDWTEHLFKAENKFDDLFDSNIVMYNPNIVRLLKKITYCQFEKEKISKGKTVACVYGVEKPTIVEKDNKCYFYFWDRSCMGEASPYNPYGVEYFYLSPKFPILTIEQSYRVFQWFKNNPKYKHLIQAYSQRPEIKSWPMSQHYVEYDVKTEIIKSVIYPDWDRNKFQAGKPQIFDGMLPEFLQWEQHLAKLPEFAIAGKKWRYHWDSFWSNKDRSSFRGQGEVSVYTTHWHYLCDSS